MRGTLAALAAATALGSASHALAAPAMVGDVASSTAVDFDVFLPLRNTAALDALLTAQQDTGSKQYHQWLTPAQFGAQFGPEPAVMARAAAALEAQGLTVTVRSRSLHVTGTAAQVNRAFATRLGLIRLKSGRTRIAAATTPVLPAVLQEAGASVPGLVRRDHVARNFARRFALPGAATASRLGQDGPYWFTDLKQAYQYPSYQTTVKPAAGGAKVRLDGTGATIGVVISSAVDPADLKADFDHENWTATTGTPDPTLYKTESVDGGPPAFSVDSDDSFEASLDVMEEVTGAPGAHVVLYGIPDLSDQSIIDGYAQVDADNTTDLVSSSFGECELYYTAAYNDGVDYTYLLQLEHELYKQGNAEGITFLASSGDEAGLECATPSYVDNGENGTFIPGVSTPAADPNVTAVGGTNVVTKYTAGSLDSTYVSENAYSDPEIPYDEFGIGALVSGGYWGAGGGISKIFAKPLYQLLTYTGSSTGRALPDVGMQVGGCPSGISELPCNGGDQAINGNGNTDRSAVIISFGGVFYGVIGTSVSSPEFAGVNALLIEIAGRQGNLNNYIYALAARQSLFGGLLPSTAVFHQSIPGYNGVVTNNLGIGKYNYTTGNGTPIVTRYLGLPSAAVAGVPQTASNP